MLMFSGKLFTIVSVVLAVAVNGSPIEVANNVCNNVPEGFDNDISSFAPSSWMSCTLFEGSGCSGKSVIVRYPGSDKLANERFDDTTSSFECIRF